MACVDSAGRVAYPADRLFPGACMPLDITLRAAGAGVLLLIAAVLLASAPRSRVTGAFLPLALGMAGFLGVNTVFDDAELPAWLWPLASFGSRMAAVALWWFCLELFDARPRAGVTLAVIGAWLLLVVVDKGYVAPKPAFEVSDLLIVFGTALVLHAGWIALRDLRGDLVERRRRARPVFALAMLAFLALDFAVDVLQGYGWRPAEFLLLQNAIVGVLALGLGMWLLRADVQTAPLLRPRAVAEDPDAAIVARIETLMREARPWLDPDLTIAAFAAQAGVAEPALRRAINHRLGHGHFRNFLNAYRVEEAQRRLRDPAAAGTKIVAIALESGFSSLASFNRVFRQVVGMSPSEYRDSAS